MLVLPQTQVVLKMTQQIVFLQAGDFKRYNTELTNME